MNCPKCGSVDWLIEENLMQCYHCKYKVRFDIVPMVKNSYQYKH